jgi:predicted site-specific integrase-resolvase
MDSCQLIRKETKMDVVHLNQKQLAARWQLSEATLERWRSEGLGPKFLKLCGRVIYRQVDIEAYEESCLATSTKTVAAQTSAG